MNALALAVVVAANVGGQLLFKLAADQVRDEHDLFRLVARLATLPAMWGAILLYGLTILAWVWVLRVVPLSVAYSVVALVFVLVPLLAVWLFREPLTLPLVIGTVLIMSGVLLIQFQAR